MSITGLRATDNWITDQRPKNWREGITLLFPNGSAPLVALTPMIKKRVTDDPEFGWFEKEFPSRRATITLNFDATIATIEVSPAVALGNTELGAGQFAPGTLLYVEETEEVMQVVSVSLGTGGGGADVITVIRNVTGDRINGVAYTSGAGVNPHIVEIGSAYEEGETSPTAVSYNPTKRFNYTQIFRDSLNITRTALKTRLRTGDQVKESKREALEIHSVGQERAFFFGKPSEFLNGPIQGTPLRTTAGILDVIANFAPTTGGPLGTGNVLNRGTVAYTIDLLEEDMEYIFRWGSQEKMGFCGSRAALIIQQVIRKAQVATYEIKGVKEFGMNITRITSPFGVLNLKTHPLFTAMPDNPALAPGAGNFRSMMSDCVVMDMDHIKYRPLVDTDTKYLPDRQENGRDGLLSEYLTECGFEWGFPRSHFWIRGLIASN
jgi:hypothetical protein